ncbi:hypothetical protein [Oryza sativa Japonica Group]|uniref:Uncharacterized protein n=1 Tax=Oryza sativa subsp. japonica TaxID=39947 RepID=Q5JLG8_ORYSJ|nr:hypothetical protein [Oryza sativa Japonica Group]
MAVSGHRPPITAIRNQSGSDTWKVTVSGASRGLAEPPQPSFSSDFGRWMTGGPLSRFPGGWPHLESV